MSQPRRIGLLLFLVTLALYLPVAWSGFCIYDDGLYVTENPMVQNGVTWGGVKWAFTTMAAFNWHPITMLSHMVDCGVFGLNPAGPHLVNALIHAANAALLFTLLWRMTEKIWPSAFIAALFAWHPMHVESVAWIAERKDVLSTLFALLSLLAYANYAFLKRESNPRAKKFLIWSLLAFALGIMAKPMLVTLPCVLLLLDFWPLQRFTLSAFRPSLLVEKIPFFLISAASSLVTLVAQSQHGKGAVASLEVVTLAYRLRNIPLAYLEYLEKTFWPAKLAIFYPLPDTIPAARLAVAIVVLGGMTLVAGWCHRTRPYLLTGWLWFLGMLVPVIGFVQVGGAQIADRYTYLASVGIFMAVTFGALDLTARWQISPMFLKIVAVVVLLASVWVMQKQLRFWQSNISLFEHALAVTADNEIVRNNLGIAFEQQGRLPEAVEQYRAASKLETDDVPGHYQGHHNLANALDRIGQHDAALIHHREAVRLGPDVQFLHFQLGLALAAANQTNAALQEFATAAKLDSHYAWPHLETARIFLRQGRDVEAVAELKAALRADANNIEILTFTAQVLASAENAAIRNGPQAATLAAKANLLANGRQPRVIDVFGMACAEMGKFDEAQMAAQIALETAGALKMQNLEPIQHRLELYKNHQPWRQSFGATNAAAVKN